MTSVVSTKQGRVSLISDPKVGSRRTHHASPPLGVAPRLTDFLGDTAEFFFNGLDFGIAIGNFTDADKLAISILLALVNNFFWNWLVTFRTSQAPSAEPRAGILTRLLHYGKVCATGMALNASLTLLLNWWGVPLPLASAAGVTLGSAWNLFFNVPAIWRSWDSPTPRRHGPVWDESGNRRLVSTGHTSSSR
jgi:hypothetical protein